MKKSLNFLAAAAAATVVLLSVPSAAKAQVAFGGTFRGPHGAITLGVGGFAPRVGVYLPSPYAEEVYENPNYGYGFYYDDQWIPCERIGSRWVIVERPVAYGRGYGYRQRYVRPYRDYGYVRPNRDYGHGYVRPQRDYGRSYGRREFDGRRDGRQFDGRRDEGRRDDGRRNGNRRSDGDNRHNRDGRQ
jgi:hypothetical protein